MDLKQFTVIKTKNFIFLLARLLDIFLSNNSSPAKISNFYQRAVKSAANTICVKPSINKKFSSSLVKIKTVFEVPLYYLNRVLFERKSLFCAFRQGNRRFRGVFIIDRVLSPFVQRLLFQEGNVFIIQNLKQQSFGFHEA